MEENHKIIAIHQPNYIPWLGYFYKIAQSDIFVLLDDVQYSNEGMHNFHYVKTPQGAFRLKIPVNQRLGDLINQVRPHDELDWKNKHLKTIEANYKRAPHFDEVFSDFSNLITRKYNSLAELNGIIIQSISQKLGIKTRFISASELNINTVREEKILDICNAVHANVYYSGTGARFYQNEENFSLHGIELRYSTYKPFEYPQLWGVFHANICILDYLMNCGYDWNRVIEFQNSN
jgi:hypothetical protein